MKIMVRIMGLTVVGLCISLMLMHSFDLMIRIDELEKASQIAMSNTQLVVMENIEDSYYKTNNVRQVINSDEAYIQMYKENLNKLKTSNGEFDVVDYKADIRKGLLYVDIDYTFNTINGNKKTINKKLLNIVDVVIDE